MSWFSTLKADTYDLIVADIAAIRERLKAHAATKQAEASAHATAAAASTAAAGAASAEASKATATANQLASVK